MSSSDPGSRSPPAPAHAPVIPAAALRGATRATRASFFIGGFGLACWAPLVPFAQARLQADPALLGTILLCLGLGAVIGMPAAGALSARAGSRWAIISGGVGIAIALPLLALLSSPLSLGLCLLLFGAALGAIDVATNIHGAEVQQAAGVPLMSGFHGFYSVGGLAGASGMTALLAAGLDIAVATAAAALVVITCLAIAIRGLLASHAQESPSLLVLPRGVVAVIGLLMLACFLVEGAVLDWGGLLLSQVKQVDVAVSGIGYTVFALAMTASRMVGDRLVSRIGERRTLLAGMALTAAGIALAAFAGPLALVLGGMALAGAAAGNIVPVLFTLAGRQRLMPAAQAIAAASILGYLGVLMGPALVGYVAHFVGLGPAFGVLGLLMLLAVAAVPAVSPGGRQ